MTHDREKDDETKINRKEEFMERSGEGSLRQTEGRWYDARLGV